MGKKEEKQLIEIVGTGVGSGDSHKEKLLVSDNSGTLFESWFFSTCSALRGMHSCPLSPRKGID